MKGGFGVSVWNRRLAPLSDAALQRIDDEARSVLEVHLAARRLFDFDGPRGWAFSAIDLGFVEPLESSDDGAWLHRRQVRPLVELRVEFELEREELENVDRGAGDVDLDPLRDAARRFAAIEDTALFEGHADSGIPGLVTDAANEGVALPDDPLRFPNAVTEAIVQLREAGVSGPYVAALGPREHAALDRTTTPAGFPVLRHVQRLLDLPIIWAPALRGGIVASARGGDFRLVCGRDATIGYRAHDDRSVRLYLEESFSAELTGPEAVVPLLPANV